MSLKYCLFCVVQVLSMNRLLHKSGWAKCGTLGDTTVRTKTYLFVLVLITIFGKKRLSNSFWRQCSSSAYFRGGGGLLRPFAVSVSRQEDFHKAVKENIEWLHWLPYSFIQPSVCTCVCSDMSSTCLCMRILQFGKDRQGSSLNSKCSSP